MINETVILLSRLEDCSDHRLARHLSGYLSLKIAFDINFYEPLQKIFSKVISYDFTKRMTEIGVKGVNREVIELVRKEHPKYVLWLSIDYEFQESTFDIIRGKGSTVVGWFFDDEFRFDDYSKWWTPHLDYCVTFDIEAVPKYKALGARVLQPITCEGIPVDRDWSSIKEKYDVSFVGSISGKPLREQYINELRNRNIPVQVFGRDSRYVPFEEMIDIFGTSKINLNFSRSYDNRPTINKGRITEVCLAGGFLLTEYTPSIENYFEIGKEIVCFKNAEEMIDKVIYYLSHDEERRAIAQAGWKRAINEYTPFHMLSRVFGKIEEDIAAKARKVSPPPQKLSMPGQIRKKFSDYYLNWGIAFSAENYKGLWKDASALSLRYYPFNTLAWYYYIAGFCPSFMRPALLRLYKTYTGEKRLYARLRSRLLCWADSVPYLRNIKRSVARRSRKKHWSFEYQWKEFDTEYLTYGLTSKDEFNSFLDDLRIDASDLKGKTVLDAGCGSGRLTTNIAAHAKMAVGIDIITLQKQKDAIFINCNIENLPFKDNCFDFVYCKGVLHHTPDPKKAFRELARVNRGKLFLMVYNKHNLFMKLRKYMFTYKYPFWMLKIFSYVLAFFLLSGVMRRLFFKIDKKKTASLQSLAFSIFDCLSPRYQSMHSFEEVRGWFEEVRYKEIVRITPDRCRVLGIK